jgi:glycosyltransferase involved in cell wall biosynthesis
MEAAYLEGSVFVMTSRFEGFGMVLIEAMSCGLPCIAFDCPYGPREIIEDGKTGYLIPYDNDDMFVERLTYLMEHPEVREQMGRAAKESVKRFSEELVMKKWKQFYESLPY